MISKLKTMAIFGLVVVALIGCGGDSGVVSISDKQYIVIIQEVPSGVCETTAFKQELKNKGFINPVTEEVNGYAYCSDYGKVSDGDQCYEDSYNDGSKSCVIGFDGLGGYGRQMKFFGGDESFLAIDALDIVQTSFVKTEY